MKICIIKLGADGDVLRTLPLAKAVKDKHKEAEITWITKGDIADLINNLDYISKVIKLPYNNNEKFDILYNFDIEDAALELASGISADKKYGFYKNSDYPAAFNLGAEYYLNTMFDDELKKTNKKTYQEMMFEVAEFPYKKERYSLHLNEKDRAYVQKFIMENNIKEEKIIGIHMGASPRWPSKAWSEKKLMEFIIEAKKRNYGIILFGGPNEVIIHKEFIHKLKESNIIVYQNNPNNSKREFASLVDMCNIMVCSDTFALHVSIGLGKKTIGLFFCTSPDEIEGYGLLKKAVSPLLYNFFPERSDEYSEDLVNSISAEEVIKLLQ